jgi:hypothetical protein
MYVLRICFASSWFFFTQLHFQRASERADDRPVHALYRTGVVSHDTKLSLWLQLGDPGQCLNFQNYLFGPRTFWGFQNRQWCTAVDRTRDNMWMAVLRDMCVCVSCEFGCWDWDMCVRAASLVVGTEICVWELWVWLLGLIYVCESYEFGCWDWHKTNFPFSRITSTIRRYNPTTGSHIPEEVKHQRHPCSDLAILDNFTFSYESETNAVAI